MAGPTRLELATSGVTGRRSNQLNYDPAKGDGEQFLATRVCHSRAALVRLRAGALRRDKPRVNISRGLGGTGLEPVAAGV
jgi:hypothetical protein